MFSIVGTPIGNLEDLSLRQAKTIMSADIILSEDTRTTGMLLEHIPLLFPHIPHPPHNPQLISYYKEREFEKLPYIFDLIEQGKNIVLISESGMPLINDPGSLLVQELVKRNVPFTVIPGPTAAVTALIHSGFKTNNFIYFGFFPKKENEMKKILQKAQETSLILGHASCIFYESSHRINETLTLISQIFPTSQIAICRELTKKFEEISRGTAKELLNKTYKGEIVLVITF